MKELIERLAERLKQNPMSKDELGDTFSACPPAPEKAVVSAEERLGFRLPQTLRAIYLNVANGWFGPGYGVMGVDGGFTDDMGHTVADLYESYRQPDPDDPTWEWAEGFLPICQSDIMPRYLSQHGASFKLIMQSKSKELGKQTAFGKYKSNVRQVESTRPCAKN